MKTSKPFSTISYNTVEFLTIKLNELITSRKLTFWAFVEHYPEDDETKMHKHLLLVPNGQIQTDSLFDYLIEIDPSNPLNKPLACVGVRSSKFFDWYMYGKHDVEYLAMKGQSRKYHYEDSDFICSDRDIFFEEKHQMDMSKLMKVKALNQAAKDGVPFEELLMSGQIPVQQVYAYQRAYDIINGHYVTYRNGREGHQSVDPNTGEIHEV